MFTKLDHFFTAFDSNRKANANIFGALSDESLGQSVAEGHRSLGGMAWHIVTTIPEMMSQTGLNLSSIDARSMPPSNAEEIAAGYETVAGELVAAIREGWTDEDLAVVDDLYGRKWPRGVTLAILVHHEIHHRGQMTVLMRQAGLKVPGIYGPSQDDWESMGMEKPPY